MPQQTSYGYSGYNAIPAQQPTNVAMYAVGGAVAGAVVGAGAMYAYNNMYGDAYGVHRRRRVFPFSQPDFCIVTAAGDRNGDFMECSQCKRLYGRILSLWCATLGVRLWHSTASNSGVCPRLSASELRGISYCPSASSCNTAAGCSYSPPESLNRDDLAATGFIPQGYAFPLKVTFSNVSGDGIVTDPLSGGLCPPVTAAQASIVESFNKTMSFKPELFLVLTKQSPLRTAQACERDTSTTCSSSCWVAHTTCVNGVCLCQSGYCWDGRECKASALAGAHSHHALSVPLLLGLVLRRLLHV